MKHSKKKLRKLGTITQDMEPLLLEMAIDHELQMGEILNLIRGYLEIHTKSKEEYVDGTKPIFYYGHRDGLK